MKTLIGKAIWATVATIMGWMVYTNNFEYLNLIQIYWALMLTLATITIPCIAIGMYGMKDDNEKLEKFIKAMAKNGKPLKQAVNLITTIITLVLLVLCNFVGIVVWYFITSALLFAINNWFYTFAIKNDIEL